MRPRMSAEESTRDVILNVGVLSVGRRVRMCLGPALLAMLLILCGTAWGQPGGQKTFASPGDAVQALFDAIRAGDMPTMMSILGSGSQALLHSGDDVADKNTRESILQKYDQMHRVVVEPDNTVTLYVGADNWPMPIPIVKNSNGLWYFDTEAGTKEVLFRRVGKNENDAIRVCYVMVDAQMEYASTTHDGDTVKQYAQKFLSDEGKQNGLFWKTGDNEPASPIGPLIAYAAGQGYSRKENAPTPFHGYIFRMLTRQGAAAPHGAQDYIVNGKETRGFAFVAYPAEHRNSGVMTFIVNKDGIVYQKDLGPQTAEIASAMQEYNPDNTWEELQERIRGGFEWNISE
jgi:hypothetical protein